MKNMKKLELTEREFKVLKLVVQGLNNSQIGEELHISQHTVKAHLESIYAKLNVSNRLQAVIKSIQLGIIEIV